MTEISMDELPSFLPMDEDVSIFPHYGITLSDAELEETTNRRATLRLRIEVHFLDYLGREHAAAANWRWDELDGYFAPIRERAPAPSR